MRTIISNLYFATSLLLCLFVSTSCASYRVVRLTRGVDSQGEVRDFYAVAQNNVIIPEYVINERGEYPTDPKIAEQRFRQRRSQIEPAMKQKYQIPASAAQGMRSVFLGTAFFLTFPLTYPLYYFGSKKGNRSPAAYFDLMMYGTSAHEPKLRDEFANF